MASYKVLKSVAHSLGHSFTSLMHHRGNDYVMGHLLRRARQVQEEQFVVDLVAGTATPDVLLTPEVSPSVARYSEWLRELVSRQGSDMRNVAAATLSVAFDLKRQRRALLAPRQKESPYLCRVEITDDRGKLWHAEFAGWWFPEPDRPKPRRTWWAFWRPERPGTSLTD